MPSSLGPFGTRRGGNPPEAAAAVRRVAAALRTQAPSAGEPGPDGWVPRDDPAVPSAPLTPAGRGGRVDLGRSGLLALAVVALVAAAGAALLAWRARPVALPAPSPSPVPAAASPVAAPPVTGPPVVVYVTGKVQRPGVVTLPAGSRVSDALRAVGGLHAGVDPGTLNLARRVVDGEQIVAGAPAQPAAAAPAPAAAATSVDGVVDLNTASVTELDALPGVGPVLAQRIVDWRTRHGPFRDVGQLREVDGIGEQRFQDLRDRVRV